MNIISECLNLLEYYIRNFISNSADLVLEANPLVSILFTFSTNLSYTVFLTASCFTTSLNLLKSTGTGTNLSMSNSSTSVFKIAKFVFNAKLEVSTCEISLISAFLHNLKDQL